MVNCFGIILVTYIFWGWFFFSFESIGPVYFSVYMVIRFRIILVIYIIPRCIFLGVFLFLCLKVCTSRITTKWVSIRWYQARQTTIATTLFLSIPHALSSRRRGGDQTVSTANGNHAITIATNNNNNVHFEDRGKGNIFKTNTINLSYWLHGNHLFSYFMLLLYLFR